MISYELKEKIQQFVDSEISVEELEDWLVPRLHLFIRDPDSDNANIVAAVELGLSELSSGIQSVEDFRKSLNDELVDFAAIFIQNPSDISVTTGSNNQTHNFERSYSSVYIRVSL